MHIYPYVYVRIHTCIYILLFQSRLLQRYTFKCGSTRIITYWELLIHQPTHWPLFSRVITGADASRRNTWKIHLYNKKMGALKSKTAPTPNLKSSIRRGHESMETLIQSVCDMMHSCVFRYCRAYSDSVVYDMTHSCVWPYCMSRWKRWSNLCMAWHIHECFHESNMTHSCVWHGASVIVCMWVSWHIHS